MTVQRRARRQLGQPAGVPAARRVHGALLCGCQLPHLGQLQHYARLLRQRRGRAGDANGRGAAGPQAPLARGTGTSSLACSPSPASPRPTPTNTHARTGTWNAACQAVRTADAFARCGADLLLPSGGVATPPDAAPSLVATCRARVHAARGRTLPSYRIGQAFVAATAGAVLRGLGGGGGGGAAPGVRDPAAPATGDDDAPSVALSSWDEPSTEAWCGGDINVLAGGVAAGFGAVCVPGPSLRRLPKLLRRR